MTAIYILLGLIAFVSLCIVVLAIIGHREQEKDRKYLEQVSKENKRNLEIFQRGVKNKKYSRASTPKAPPVMRVIKNQKK